MDLDLLLNLLERDHDLGVERMSDAVWGESVGLRCALVGCWLL